MPGLLPSQGQQAALLGDTVVCLLLSSAGRRDSFTANGKTWQLRRLEGVLESLFVCVGVCEFTLHHEKSTAGRWLALVPSSRALGSVSASEMSPLSFPHGAKMRLGLQPLCPRSYSRTEGEREKADPELEPVTRLCSSMAIFPVRGRNILSNCVRALPLY